MRVADDLKPHNRETIEKILDFFKTEKKCCAIQATGTGKTFLILRLLEIFNDEGKVAVVFAPNREIIKQTKKRMKKFGLNNASFYTYQKLARMTEEEIYAIKTDLIICDELHRTGAKTWGQKFEQLVDSHPDSKVFGVTATPLRCADGRDMAEEYFDGNKACDISLAEALVREIIPVMPLYVSALYTFEEEYQKMSNKIDKANNSNKEKAELQKELLAAKQQLEKANGVPEIIKKYITNYNGKYLVFCKDKKHLYAMKDVVIGWFREAGYNGRIFEYPYYSNSNIVKNNLENFESNKEEGLKLLFIIDKLNEGLHLEEVHGCILLRTTVSNIIYYQQIGRAIDAGSDEQRVILDLVSNFNSLKSFNFKSELQEKVNERQEGRFSDCSVEFEIGKFDVVDCVKECVDVFEEIDNKILPIYKKWSNEEIEILKKYYSIEGNKVYKRFTDRTPKECECKAYKIGLRVNAKESTIRNINWSEEEVNILIEKYSLIGSAVCQELNNKTKSHVIKKAKEIGLSCRKIWSENEINILKRYYAEEGYKVCKRIGRNRRETQEKARRLGLTNLNLFTEQEDNILKEFYPKEGSLSFDRIKNHSNKSCEARVHKLNLSCNIKDKLSNERNGMRIKLKNGREIQILEYRSYKDVDIIFLDTNEIKKSISYYSISH